MNDHVKRHKILEILTQQFVKCENGVENILGVKSEIIKEKLKCDDTELRTLTSVLYNNDEIGYHDAYDIVGIYCKESGAAAYSEKKYLKLARREKIDSIKDFVQIIIPILSLLVALAAIFYKIENVNKSNDLKFEKLELKIDSLNNNIEKQNLNQKNIKTPPNRREPQ